MTKKIAINGFGRIGRNFLRASLAHHFSPTLKESKKSFEIVAINDLGSLESLAHLLQFDSTHGTFEKKVSVAERELKGQVFQGLSIKVGEDSDGGESSVFIPVSHEPEPLLCPWQIFDVDVVLESTGNFRARADAQQHIEAGAKKVIIGAVSFDEVDAITVYGVNEKQLKSEDLIISAASCTTHCIAPVLKLLNEELGVETVLMTEMHAYTSDQQILDHTHRDLRRARSGAQNIIPTTSSSIGAVQKVIPELKGKVAGYSMRVPINNVAAVDLTINLSRESSIEEVLALFRNYPAQNILAYSDLPLVSSDFNHRSESAIFDATQISLVGQTLKILIWYDNEWGYVNRLIDLLDEF